MMDPKLKYPLLFGLMLLSAYAGHWLTVKSTSQEARVQESTLNVQELAEHPNNLHLGYDETGDRDKALALKERKAALRKAELARKQAEKNKLEIQQTREELLSRFQEEIESLAEQSAKTEARVRNFQDDIERAAQERLSHRLRNRKVLSNREIHLIPVGDIEQFAGFEQLLQLLTDIKSSSPLKAADYKDKEVLLVWWEGQCESVCGKTLINLEQIYSKHHLSGFVPIFIHFDENRTAELKLALDRLTWLVTYPVAVVDSYFEREVRRLLGPARYPMSMMVDRKGRIVNRHFLATDNFSSRFARKAMQYLKSEERLQLVEESKLEQQQKADLVAQQP